MDIIKTFRIVALTEATTFLLLLVSSAVKHTAGNATGVEILGPVHGALFLAYIALAAVMKIQLGWPLLTTLAVMAGAVVPFGGYIVDRWIARQLAAERTDTLK